MQPQQWQRALHAVALAYDIIGGVPFFLVARARPREEQTANGWTGNAYLTLLMQGHPHRNAWLKIVTSSKSSFLSTIGGKKNA